MTDNQNKPRWKHRIVGSGTQKADQFLHHPLNPKYHPPEQREALRAILDSVGQIARVIVSKNSGYLLDGHERVWLGLESNEDIDFDEVDVTEAEEFLILATLDPVGWMAKHDAAKLKEVTEQIDTEDATLGALLEQIKAEAGLVPVSIEVPPAPPKEEPALRSEVLIEIRCTKAILDRINQQLSEWSQLDGCSIDIS